MYCCAGVVFVQITFPCFQLSSDVLSTLPNVKSVTHSSITISTATFDFPSFQATTRMQRRVKKKKLLALLEKWLAWGDFARIACLQGWRLDVKRLLVKRWGIAQKRRLDSLLTSTEVKVAFKAPFSFPGGETTFSGDPIQIPVEDQLSLSSGWSRMRTKETKIWMTQRDLPH